MEERGELWEVLLRFYNFRGWRVVEANDGNGVRCNCLLLPMEQNGISLTPDNRNLPFMKIGAYPSVREEGAQRSGLFRMLYPIIPKEMHDRLLEQGLAHEDDVHWAGQVGGIRKKNWRSTTAPYRGWRRKKS